MLSTFVITKTQLRLRATKGMDQCVKQDVFHITGY